MVEDPEHEPRNALRMDGLMMQKQKNVVYFEREGQNIPIRIKKYVTKDNNNLYYNKICKSTVQFFDKERKYVV